MAVVEKGFAKEEAECYVAGEFCEGGKCECDSIAGFALLEKEGEMQSRSK
jgi:predicted NAD/FAD-dependent oxidoreductase